MKWKAPPPTRRIRRVLVGFPSTRNSLLRTRKKLFRRIRRMQQHAEDLEQRVRDRTRALEDANRRLAREIEDRNILEERLWTSLREKDALLKEVHHRVKNNLQVVSSLLNMSANRARNREAAAELNSAEAKVRAMAMIHSRLFQGNGLDTVVMEEQARELFDNLAAIHNQTGRIRLFEGNASTRLTVRQAIPMALVLNELLSNSLKHAYDRDETGSIETAFVPLPGCRLEFTYRDDGAGLPPGMNIHETEGLGLRLVRVMSTVQLGGVIEPLAGPGLGLRIVFPVQEASSDICRENSSG